MEFNNKEIRDLAEKIYNLDSEVYEVLHLEESLMAIRKDASLILCSSCMRDVRDIKSAVSLLL